MYNEWHWGADMNPGGIAVSASLVGLIGWPVEHSLSPVMHNAVFDALDLAAAYLPLPVPPGQAGAALCGLAALGFRGLNVTVPHKRSVMSVLDGVTAEAGALGAINTIVVRHDAYGKASMKGYNTDVPGFVGALRRAGLEPKCVGETVVLGAGGAARAVVYGLLAAGAGRITVVNRTLERAEALVADLGRHGDWSGRLRALPQTSEALVESARAADLLVHATVLGMWPRTEGLLWPDSVRMPSNLSVVDLVYNPLQTRLLELARRSGAHVIDGLEMLVLQGALALNLWFDQALDLEVVTPLMRAACEQVLRRNGC